MAVPISILATRVGPSSPLKFFRGVPPPLRASKFAPIFGRGSKGEKMTFGAAWTLKTELPPTRELNFHKIAEFRKIRKSKKKWSEKRPPGRDKNRLDDPICLRVGGLAAPAGTNMCPCGSTMQKMSKAGLPETNKLVQDTEKQRKACLESAQKRPSA